MARVSARRVGCGLALAALLAGAATACQPPPQHTRLDTQPTVLTGTLQGGDPPFPDGTPGIDASITPSQVLAASDGSIYISTPYSKIFHLVGGKAYLVVGGGRSPVADGIAATDVGLNPASIAVAPDSTLYLSTEGAIYRRTSDGILHAVPVTSLPGDPATDPNDAQTQLGLVTIDSSGRQFVRVPSRPTLRQLSPDGTQRVVLGGGTAPLAEGASATGVAIKLVSAVGAPDGTIDFVHEDVYRNDQIWQVRTDGTLHLLARTSTYGCSCPGDPMTHIVGLAVDHFSEVYATNSRGSFKIRGDGEQQSFRIGSGAISIGPDDQLIYVSDYQVLSSPSVADGPDGYSPYATLGQSIAAQLARFHSAADAPTVSGWNEQMLQGHLPPPELIYQLEHRSEYADVVAPVSRLYRATYRRGADASGLKYWTDRRFGGLPLGSVASLFTESAEFTATYGNLTDGAFVDQLYANVLGRPADAGGRAYWLDQLHQGRTRGDVLLAFSESDEFVAAQHVETEATLATFGLLGRPPTAAELAMWTDRLAHHHQEVDLVAWEWYSAEHRARVLAGG